MDKPSNNAASLAARPKSLKPPTSSSSFGWANGEPVRYKDPAKALQKAHALASDVLSAKDDDFTALVARKRKTYEELKPKKRQKQTALVKDDSIGSTACSDMTCSSANEEDIEWSDCDETELSRNISILEQSINNGCQPLLVSPMKKSVQPANMTPVKSPSKKRMRSSPVKLRPEQVTCPDIVIKQANFSNYAQDNGDPDELEWSDCDEAEISRNISLLEQSFGNPSDEIAIKQDRSTLREISNTSKTNKL